MGLLTGKKAFITGAEQGIGKESAKKLIEAGCDIYIHYFSGEEGPRELIAFAEQRGARAALMNPLMILVKIIKLRWIHILSYDQMVSRKINNQTTRCANSIF
ncbi:SDR family NAD(P)-dependent oxidoreductase, partial [Klebsiella oxytoca]|uniref:SDR family NAD(P)-dependent oxidoreductase n=1 Tax=Klebsiella oxytoca TaxID=571 RepID=UPI002598C6CA